MLKVMTGNILLFSG